VAHHPPESRHCLIGGVDLSTRSAPTHRQPLATLQATHALSSLLGGWRFKTRRPASVPGASGARRAPPCPGPPARTVRVQQPPRGALVRGPASLRPALFRMFLIPGSPSLLCMPTSFHLVGYHGHLLPPHPVRIGLHLIRSPKPGPAGQVGERPRPPVRQRDHRPPR
jgi:hypothetical protein